MCEITNRKSQFSLSILLQFNPDNSDDDGAAADNNIEPSSGADLVLINWIAEAKTKPTEIYKRSWLQLCIQVTPT